MNPSNPLDIEARRDRQKGLLYGMAIGDALGAPVEFKQRDTFAPVTTYRSGTHNLTPGQWTDDTSMAVAMAVSLQKGFDLFDQLDRYAEWRSGDKRYHPRGCFDIGGQTSGAIGLWNTHHALKQDRPDRAGNGSIMRLAPVPAAYLPHNAEDAAGFYLLADLCGLSSITTHASARCIQSCRMLGVICGLLMRGMEPGELAGESYELAVSGEVNRYAFGPLEPAQIDRDTQEMWLKGRFVPGAAKRSEISSSGYVLHTLEAALWCFYNTETFDEAVLMAANLGNDSDSVGAVTGQIAGAYYGYHAISAELREGLQDQHILQWAFDPLFA
jgi:ADP-ribosyl-[dinitrogen reductase] hydrolase